MEKLARNARTLRSALASAGLRRSGGESHIVPVVVGTAQAAAGVCERALRGGVFAQAIRPPTVPEGTSRLRLTAMASHTTDELRDAARIVAEAMSEGAAELSAARADRRLLPAA